MSNTKQLQEVPTVTPQKGVNKLELYRQALQCKEHEQKVAATSKSARNTPMKTPEERIGISDASLSAKRNETSPHVLGLKMGCTFSKGVAPCQSLGLVHRQKDNAGNIDINKTFQPKTGKMAMVELEKVDDRINHELSKDLSGEQEIEAENSNGASMKLKSTSDEEDCNKFCTR